MLNIVVVLAVLALAVYSDLKRGRIPNGLFISMLALSVPLHLTSNVPLILYLLNIIVTFLIAGGLWRLGAWGGGDAKLIIGMAALMPTLDVGLFIPPYGSFFVLPFLLNFIFVYLFRIFHLAYTKLGKQVFRVFGSVLLGLSAFYALSLMVGGWSIIALLLLFVGPNLRLAAFASAILFGLYLGLAPFSLKIFYTSFVLSAFALENGIGMLKPSRLQYKPVKLSPILAVAFMLTVIAGDLFWGIFF